MTYGEYKEVQERLRRGEVVSCNKPDYQDMERYAYFERKEQMLPELYDCAVVGDWEGFCDIAILNYQVMPEAFTLYEKMPEQYRHDFVIECYTHHGDSVPACRKALRELPPNGINELPPEYARMPETTIYRAGEESIDKAHNRLSWTLDIEKAYFFLDSYIGRHASHLYKGTIKPHHVIAYTNDREEHEVIQYRHVYNIEEIKSR